MGTKLRIYKQGDATGKLIHDPHGKRKYGYGHWGYEYGYTLYVYKGDIDKGYVFAMSLPSIVYIAYVKAIVKAVSETKMPTHRVSGNAYWLKGKMWQRRPSGGKYPILRED